jgi:hypothetical protein
MALTLAEAAKLSNDVLLQGVVEEIIKDSPILQRLPFIEIVGNGLTYNRENALPTVSWYDVGDTWAESTPTFTQVTATLKILGGDADVDNYIRATRSNIQDIEAAVIELKAKATRHEFENVFINGDTATNAKQFDGVDKLCVSGQTVSMGTNGGTLTLEKLDQLIDAVLGGKPDMLLMSRRSRRKLTSLMRALGSMSVEKDDFGQFVVFYNGIPVYINDWISDTKTVGTSTDCSTIYAFQMGEGALAGLTAPGHLVVERIGSLESKDATRTRIKWYCSLALFSTVKLAKLIGVRD